LHGLGLLAYQAGHPRPAVELVRRAVAKRPNVAEFLQSLGLLQFSVGDSENAIESCKKAVSIKPNSPDAYNNLANALFTLGRLEESIQAYKKALSYKPEFPEAYSNLGNVLTETGHAKEAIAACKRALELRQNFPDAFYNLGNAYLANNETEKATIAYRQAIAMKPAFPKAYNNLGNILKENGFVDEAIICYDQSMVYGPLPAVASNRVYLLQFHPRYDANTLLAEVKGWNDQFGKPMAKFIRPSDNDRDPDRKLRIGFLSPDFRTHVVGRNILPLIRNHDRSNFEVFCYADVFRPDYISEKFKSAADHWRPIATLRDEAVADMIRKDKIDILVDLALHLSANRLPLLATKPAPILVTFGGYPGTTGLDTMDYRLTDPYLDPPGETDALYSEKSVRLPDSFWCFDPDAMEVAELPVGPMPSLANGYITFGCLNNFCKVNDGVLELWAKVLARVPDSRLLLLVPPCLARQRVSDKLLREGIDPKRVEFVSRQDRDEYFKVYNRIDIGLDTFPYNGHTTSLDSLWMGVPVVTLIGQTVVGRAGWSQLCNLNLRELAANTPEQFETIAVDLANDPDRLKQLRQSMRDRMRSSPLCDSKKFTQGIESALRDMWRQWSASGK
jgi:predicted O-linked N-acetylglucosamine transferase (SPINDLY family)